MPERCPVCGNVDTMCEGHVGAERRVILYHDKGRHEACSPSGCDTAFDHWIESMMTTPMLESA
jgi:hypothetical protein